MEYSGTGHLARLIAPDGQVVAIKHDADERPVEVLDERLQRYRREYDRADRIVSESTFDGRLLEYRYNRAGRVVRIDYPDGEWRELSHDKLGNVLEDRGADVQITFERDSEGRLVRAVCTDAMATVVTEIERDAWGRVVAETQNGRTLRREYDGYGRTTARVVAEGVRTEYRYDGDDLLVGVSHGDRSVAIQRDWEGRERVRESGSWRLDTDRDSLGRRSLDRVAAFDQGRWTPVLSRQFSYDAAGRIVALADSRRGVATYGYDPSDRLTDAVNGNLREAFEYDPTGSLVGAVRTRGADREEAPERWSFGSGNVLKTAGDTRYRYDGRGRRIQRIEADRTGKGSDRVTLYGWDTKDRLREVVLPDGKRVRFAYDAFGRRVRKTVLSAPDTESPAIAGTLVETTVDYLWDGNVICEERHRTAAAERDRLHVHTPGTFTPLLQIEGGSVFGVLVNQVGVVTDLIDDRGRVAWQARHGAWGDVVAVDRDPHSAVVESPFRLLGQIADDETGLCSTRFRYFEAEHGRWLSPDPIEIEGGLNHMAFGGAPTLSSDAWGLAYEPWQPHSPSDDWFPKGTHFYTNNDKVEVGVLLNEDGNVDFGRVAGKKGGVSQVEPEILSARERLKENATWRWQLLKNLAEGVRQEATDPNAKKRAHGAEMDKVRAALAKLIANKGN
jgi:RHS repeat-associated protein